MAKITPEKSGSAASALREQVEKYGGPSDKTVVRFEYTFDEPERRYDNGKKIKREYYTYVAVWIENAAKWYITGISDNIRRTQSNLDFMTLLASEKVKRAEVAVAFEGFKP